MARLIRLAPRYLSDVRRLGVQARTPAAREVGRVVATLETTVHLPAPGDVYTFVPEGTDEPSALRALAHVRRVPRRNLWVWYWATADELQVVALTNVPPIRT